MLRLSVCLEGQAREALLDTGSSFTLVRIGALNGYRLERDGRVWLEMMDGKLFSTAGSAHVQSMVVDGKELGPRSVQVMGALPLGVDVILGLDVVRQYGLKVTNSQTGKRSQVEFACVAHGSEQTQTRRAVPETAGGVDQRVSRRVGGDVATQVTEVSDKDFTAMFSGGKWTVAWKWIDAQPKLSALRRPNYYVKEQNATAFNNEIKSWVDHEILVPWDELKHGAVKNMLPLMCVKQVKGNVEKVRPVLDFRQLNKCVLSLAGQNMATCDESLREWRMKGEGCAVVDLKRAYLQVHVSPELWVYQAVLWEGKVYLLTRLGFWAQRGAENHDGHRSKGFER